MSLFSFFKRKPSLADAAPPVKAAAPRSAAVPGGHLRAASGGNVPAGGDASAPLARIIRPQATGRWSLPMLGSMTPQYIEMLLRAAMAGDHQRQWEMFDLMLDTWPELAACAAELTEGVMGRELNFAPYQDEDEQASDTAKEKAKLVSAALRTMQPDVAADENDLDGLVRDLIDGWFRGVTVQEIVWANRKLGALGTCLAPMATVWVHPANYGFAEGRIALRSGSNSESKIQNSKSALVPFPPQKFLLGIHKAKSGSVPAGALLRPLAWWWCAANFSADWLLRLAEIFGLPFRWAQFDPNAPQSVIDSICSMLQNMGSAGWAAFPTGTTLEMKEPGKGGSDHSPQGELLDRADRYARLLVLGQTQSGGKGSAVGGQAFGSVEADVKTQRIESCAAYVAGVLNAQFLPAILALNYGADADECPVASFDTTEEEDLAQSATIVQTLCLAGAGSIIGKDWLGKKFGIPKPSSGEETLAAAAAPTTAGSPAGKLGSAASTQTSASADNSAANELLPATKAKDAVLARILGIQDDAIFSKALADLATAVAAGDAPGHEFHGNQWSQAHEAALKEQRDKCAGNKYKQKALKDSEKASREIAPGTHGRMADSAIAKAEQTLAANKPRTIDAGQMLRSDSAMTRHMGDQMHGEAISPSIHAQTRLDAAEREIQDHGRMGNVFHPEAFPAVAKIREAKARLFASKEEE